VDVEEISRGPTVHESIHLRPNVITERLDLHGTPGALEGRVQLNVSKGDLEAEDLLVPVP